MTFDPFTQIEPFPILLDRFYVVLAYIVGICMALALVCIVCIKIFNRIERGPEA